MNKVGYFLDYKHKVCPDLAPDTEVRAGYHNKNACSEHAETPNSKASLPFNTENADPSYKLRPLSCPE
jgi:hypothetical protein